MTTPRKDRLLNALNLLGQRILRNIQTITDVFVVIALVCVIVITIKWTLSIEKETIPVDPISEPTPEIVIEEPEHVPSGPSDADETWSKQEHECLALNVYHESRSDSFAGRIAVADVTLNRVESRLFPNTICEVVKQANMRTDWKGNTVPVRGMCHFSWFCDGLSDEPMEADAYEEAVIIADMSLRGGWRGITEGATHYHATYVTPNWINDRGMVPVGRIGEHKFYRWH
tara:strand:- start:64 stop:750 length:687 start_codon:yes stop_codon:yes gene_type:complete